METLVGKLLVSIPPGNSSRDGGVIGKKIPDDEGRVLPEKTLRRKVLRTRDVDRKVVKSERRRNL